MARRGEPLARAAAARSNRSGQLGTRQQVRHPGAEPNQLQHGAGSTMDRQDRFDVVQLEGSQRKRIPPGRSGAQDQEATRRSRDTRGATRHAAQEAIRRELASLHHYHLGEGPQAIPVQRRHRHVDDSLRYQIRVPTNIELAPNLKDLLEYFAEHLLGDYYRAGAEIKP